MKIGKKSVKKRAEESVSVVKNSSDNKEVLKKGVPVEHSRKHLEENTIGMNIGHTLNMGDYESLRVDAWATVSLEDGKSIEQGYSELFGILDKTIKETVNYYSPIE